MRVSGWGALALVLPLLAACTGDDEEASPRAETPSTTSQVGADGAAEACDPGPTPAVDDRDLVYAEIPGVDPDRLSLDPRSSYFNQEVLERGVGIRFNGQEKTNVEEYCISEGWIKVAAGRSRDRYGNPMTITLKGTVEPYFEDTDKPGDE